MRIGNSRFGLWGKGRNVPLLERRRRKSAVLEKFSSCYSHRWSPKMASYWSSMQSILNGQWNPVVGVPIHAIVGGRRLSIPICSPVSFCSLFLSSLLASFFLPSIVFGVYTYTQQASKTWSWRKNLSRGARHHAQTDGAFPFSPYFQHVILLCKLASDSTRQY